MIFKKQYHWINKGLSDFDKLIMTMMKSYVPFQQSQKLLYEEYRNIYKNKSDCQSG